MKAQPWSHTGLKDAENCLRKFYEVRVLKKYPHQADTEEAKYGRYVHQAFEDRQSFRTELPLDLRRHEPFMLRLEGWDGFFFTEQKAALNRQLKPCNRFDSEVWWRGDVDYVKIHNLEHRGRIVDYKTGKKRADEDQLIEYTLWGFAEYPEINIFDTMFYWTQLDGDEAITRHVYSRDQVPALWSRFVPALKRLKNAYDTDQFPATKNGLCGWCPVKDCPNWWDHNERKR